MFFIELRNFYRWIWSVLNFVWTSILLSSRLVPILSCLNVIKLALSSAYSRLDSSNLSSSSFLRWWLLSYCSNVSASSFSSSWSLARLIYYALAKARLLGESDRLRLRSRLTSFLRSLDNSFSNSFLLWPVGNLFLWDYVYSSAARSSIVVAFTSFSSPSSFACCFATFSLIFASRLVLVLSWASLLFLRCSSCSWEITCLAGLPETSC